VTNPRELDVTIHALASSPDRLQHAFNSFPADRLGWKPPLWDGIPSERLTAIEQLCHIRDVEVEGYRIRFHRTRTELSPVLPDLPGELMARERNYAVADPVEVLRDFAAARIETVSAIRDFSPNELRREAIFEGRPTTLAGLVHFLCSHDFQHLSGLEWLLAKMQQR
jgi:hypothetical protein